MFDAYKIGVTLSLTNHVSKGLMLMAKDFAKTEAEATLLQKRINSMKNDALKGGLLLGLGGGMLALLKGPYEEAKKLAQAQANFQTLNLSSLENSQAFGKAASMSHKILGTTITENVKLIHDLHTAFGDLHHAIGSADMFAKMSFVGNIANGGKDVDGLVNGAAKALEHRGGKVVNDPVQFAAEADLMTKVMLATKMRVSPKDYLTASGTGKMAYQLFDKEYLYGNFAGLMAINGGARSGTEAMTAFSSLIGGHMDSKAKGFLADIGLWQEGFSKKRLGIMSKALSGLSPDERRVAVRSMGGQAVISGGLKDADAELFSRRPDLFIQKILPMIRTRFGMDLTDDQIGLMLAKHFNRATGNFLGTQVTMATKLDKDTNIVNKSMGINDGYKHYLKTPEGAEKAAHAAWNNFFAVFGSVYLPAITNGLLQLASALDNLGQWVERNKGLVKGLVYAFAALAGGLMLRGTVLLLTAAMKGLGLSLLLGGAGGVGGGVSLLGTAVAALATPVGIVIAALGLLAAAAYAFRPMSQSEVDGVKTEGGVKLSPGAAARLKQMGISPAKITSGFGPKLSGLRENPNGFYAQERDREKNASVMDQFIATGSGGGSKMINNTIVMPDGQVLAKVVTKEQAKSVMRPQTGTGRFDGGMMAPFAGAIR